MLIQLNEKNYIQELNCHTLTTKTTVMKKILLVSLILSASYSFISCSSKETAQSVAEEWCNLNAKVKKAAEGPEYEAAKQARKEYEEKMEAKYKDNEAFMKEVKEIAEKCD